MIFEGFSEQIKGFPKDAKPYATAKPGVKRAPSSRRDSAERREPYVLRDRHAAKARLKRRASLDALWRLAMTERPLSSEASDRAGWVNRMRVRSPTPEGMLKSGLLSLVFRSASRRRHSAIFAWSPLKSHGDLRYALVETGRNKVVVSTKNVQTGMIDLFGGAVTICTFGACRSSSDGAYILRAIR